MKRFSRSTRAAIAVALGLSLVAAACGDDGGGAEETTTTAAGGTTTAPGDTTTTAKPNPKSPIPTGGPLSKAAEGKDGGEVVVGADQEFTSYNNNTAEANALANTIVLTPVQPQLTYFDEKGSLWLDEDTVKQVEITKESPLTVVWTLNDKAVWSDGEAFD
ncbi:MAG TPA: hypothetical protein VF855_01080, partial [Acidimicrobiales bacterium]